MQVRSFLAGRRRPSRRFVVPLTTAILAAAVLAPGSALAATPYGANLAKNGSFQNGLSGWDTFLNPVVRTYSPATSGFPKPKAGSAIGGGSKFLYLGPADILGCGQAEQHIKLKGIASAIDGGKVKVRLRGYVATQGGADFHAHLDLFFRDSNNHQVPNGSNGIERSVQQTNQKYVSINVSRKLPKGTRQLYLKLWADGTDPETTSDCPGFYDKISVVITRV